MKIKIKGLKKQELAEKEIRSDKVIEIISEDSNYYMTTLEYMYLGLLDTIATGKLASVRLECPYSGYIEKRYNKVIWGLEDFIPSSTVVYKVSVEEGIIEKLCYADRIESVEQVSREKKKVSIAEENRAIFVGEEDIKERADLVKISALLLAKSGINYMYKLVGKEIKLVRKETEEVVDIEDIKEDDEYYALKLLGLQLQKKRGHLGVVFIDGKGMRKEVVEFIKSIQELFRGDSFNIFTYAKNLEFRDERIVSRVELPKIE